jgi:hypothetical protein
MFRVVTDPDLVNVRAEMDENWYNEMSRCDVFLES